MSTLRVAATAENCEVLAPEPSFGVWVQGCSICCPGCAAAALWDPEGGVVAEAGELARRARAAGSSLALLGGEPLDQAEGAKELCETARAAGLAVTLYTGYARDAAIERHPWILSCVDLLLAGPFMLARRREGLPFVGSDNQTVDYLTSRYERHEPEGAACELRIGADGGITLFGYPGADLVDSIT